MIHGKIYDYQHIWFPLAFLLDIGMTWKNLANGFGELNPLSEFLFELGGFNLTFLTGAVIMSFFVFYFKNYDNKTSKIAVNIIFLVYIFVVTNNSIIYFIR